jgi:hypothetical protein
MVLDDFSNLMTNIIDKDYPVREIPLCFNLSMKLQVNEIDYERHLNMQFYEFIEAFARVVDKLSPFPVTDNPVLYKI